MPALRSGNYRIVFRFLVSYMVVLLVPLTIGLYTYNKTVSLLQKEAADKSMSLLRQGMDTLDRRLSEVETITHQIMSDTKVSQFLSLRNPYQGTATYQVVEFQQSLYDYTLMNRFISGYYLLFKNSGLAVTSNASFALPDFYRNVFRYHDVPYEQWYDQMLNQYHSHDYLPAADSEFKGVPKRMIAYVQSLGYFNLLQGDVVVLIDNEQVRKLLEGLDIADGGWAYVADSQGRMISYVSTLAGDTPPQVPDLKGDTGLLRRTVNGRDVSVTYLTSQMSGWKYVAVQPLEAVLQKVHYIANTMLAVLAASLLIGAAVSCMFAYRNSGPVRRMVSLIVERSEVAAMGTANAYRFIQESLTGLLDRNEQLRTEMDKQRPFLRSALFERLLRGDIASDEEAQPLLAHAGLRGQAKAVMVALLQLGDKRLEALDLQRMMVREAASAELNGIAYLHELSQDKMALLFFHGNTAEGSMITEHGLTRLRGELAAKYGIRPTIALGGVYERLTDAHRSYEEANLALNAHTGGDEGDRYAILRYSDLPASPKGYYFPPDIQARLMNLARAGEKLETIRQLEELFRINTEQRSLSMYMLRLLVGEIWGSAVKLADQMAVADAGVGFAVRPAELQLESRNDVERLFRHAVKTYADICDYVAAGRRSRTGDATGRLTDFMRTHYVTADLNVSMAADRFGISDKYFPQWFKEQTGITFTDYVLKLRMERAQQLLLDTDLSIKEIAEQVGYQSSNTFCRAFKRFHGVNATSYRDSI